MQAEDNKHVDEFGDLKDTKYWFKRDIDTIKQNFRQTVKISPVLLIIALVLSFLINYSYSTLSFTLIIVTMLLFFPIVLLGHFLFLIMIRKGYNISRSGTVIDTSRSSTPFEDLK